MCVFSAKHRRLPPPLYICSLYRATQAAPHLHSVRRFRLEVVALCLFHICSCVLSANMMATDAREANNTIASVSRLFCSVEAAFVHAIARTLEQFALSRLECLFVRRLTIVPRHMYVYLVARTMFHLCVDNDFCFWSKRFKG